MCILWQLVFQLYQTSLMHRHYTGRTLNPLLLRLIHFCSFCARYVFLRVTLFQVNYVLSLLWLSDGDGEKLLVFDPCVMQDLLTTVSIQTALCTKTNRC